MNSNVQSVVSSSHTGLVRVSNQDKILSTTSGLFSIADGMGGLIDGEKAAALAIAAVERRLHEFSQLAVRGVGNLLFDLMSQCVTDADYNILRMTQYEGVKAGSTMLIWIVHGRTVWYSWIGDSVLYLFSDGKLLKLTPEHTLAQRKIVTGRAMHIVPRDHHVLTRCVGAGASTLAEFGCVGLSAEDSILFGCTDGYSMVSFEKIAACFRRDASLEVILTNLELLVLGAGATDNYSAILVRPILS